MTAAKNSGGVRCYCSFESGFSLNLMNNYPCAFVQFVIKLEFDVVAHFNSVAAVIFYLKKANGLPFL